ncbi:MAG: hypothetical protein HQM14_11255 [SAR324 cluster bacterium]|nr:hypothetical protein [SAR324 cluster bacterium]
MSLQGTKKNIMVAALLIGSSLFAAHTNGLFDEIMDVSFGGSTEQNPSAAHVPKREPSPKVARPQQTVAASSQKEKGAVSPAVLEQEVSQVIQSPWGKEPFYSTPISNGAENESLQARRHAPLSNDPLSAQDALKAAKRASDKAWQAITVYKWPNGEWFGDDSKENSEGRKPLRTADEQGEGGESLMPPSLVLKMVFFNGKQWTAVVDDGSSLVSVRKGDSIGSQEVIQVDKERVMLQSNMWGEQHLVFVNKSSNLQFSVAANKPELF